MADRMIPDDLTRDLEFFKEAGCTFQVTEEGPRIYIIFKDYPLPPGVYSVEKTDVLIFTTQFYPNAGFDMFWVDDKLTLRNGCAPKNAEQLEGYLGRSWRRFSYHPYSSKPWNPSEDNVASFMAYVRQRLMKGD
jgi:hypothetical protein